MSDAAEGKIVHLPRQGVELYRASTDAAGLCKEIVVRTAIEIQGRRYVRVEGWQALAIAHGCFASSGEVERVNDPECPGYRAVGKVVRADNGQTLATAEGFVGDDEKTWQKRPVYARRAMAQTRAISRACRSAFAHVVVMMGAGLETTPAEEVPREGFDHDESANLEERLKASIALNEAKKVTKAKERPAASDGEYLMPFASKQGRWEKGAPIASLSDGDLLGLAKWKGAKDDLRAAVDAEIARRANDVEDDEPGSDG